MQAAIILLVFVLTYIGMAAGRLPWLQVDRTGIALLGVILLLATEALTLDDVGANIDMPTLIAGVQARGLDPRPFVIALAAATNAGSAATFIGNPQNILIGEIGNLSFATFLVACGVPALVALVIVFAVIWVVWHDRMTGSVMAATGDIALVASHPPDRNQTIKGVIATLALLALFTTSLPREIGALVIAALLLANRKFTSRTMIAAVDWPLLLLFACLFGITGALADTGIPWAGISQLQ